MSENKYIIPILDLKSIPNNAIINIDEIVENYTKFKTSIEEYKPDNTDYDSILTSIKIAETVEDVAKKYLINISENQGDISKLTKIIEEIQSVARQLRLDQTKKKKSFKDDKIKIFKAEYEKYISSIIDISKISSLSNNYAGVLEFTLEDIGFKGCQEYQLTNQHQSNLKVLKTFVAQWDSIISQVQSSDKLMSGLLPVIIDFDNGIEFLSYEKEFYKFSQIDVIVNSEKAKLDAVTELVVEKVEEAIEDVVIIEEMPIVEPVAYPVQKKSYYTAPKINKTASVKIIVDGAEWEISKDNFTEDDRSYLREVASKLLNLGFKPIK